MKKRKKIKNNIKFKKDLRKEWDFGEKRLGPYSRPPSKRVPIDENLKKDKKQKVRKMTK